MIRWLAIWSVMLAGPALAEDPAVLWTEQGGQAQVQSFGGAAQDARFVIASVSKPMMAVAVLRMVERGELALEAPVASAVPPEVAAGFGGLRGVTLWHLLAMRSGLPDYYDDAAFEADLAGPLSVPAALRFGYGAPDFAPGARFDYSNTNYLLAELIATQVSGLTLDALLRREVFAPSGMQGAHLVGTRTAAFVPGRTSGLSAAQVARVHSDPGYGDGGVVASAAEVAAFWRALLIDRRLLGPAMLAQLLSDPDCDGYGLGIEVEQVPPLGIVLGHSGGDVGFSADARVVPERGLIAVILAAREDVHDETAWDALWQLCSC